ncbi:MAG: AAA family ATPase [Deltaproteobacteria bacterium]|nr:AAA family ATPase [Deltaproteobacteria bacterium]
MPPKRSKAPPPTVYDPAADIARLRAHAAGAKLKLEGDDGLPNSVHLVGDDEPLALQAALVTRRPLLLRGKPGVGKSQVARAAAVMLERALVIETVDASTETADLRYRVDAVRRLATAQLRRDVAPPAEVTPEADPLHLMHFVQPGALWWAYDWAGAEALSKHGDGCGRWRDGSRKNGVVVLIDEIDKADPAVPNALLDVLANGGFDDPAHRRICARDGAPPPLVIITTNEERALPDAFLRRCLVLHLDLPTDLAKLRPHLRDRAKLHFPSLQNSVLEAAVDRLVDARAQAAQEGANAPGLAELVDLLRAVTELAQTQAERLEMVRSVQRLAFYKHRAQFGGAEGGGAP